MMNMSKEAREALDATYAGMTLDALRRTRNHIAEVIERAEWKHATSMSDQARWARENDLAALRTQLRICEKHVRRAWEEEVNQPRARQQAAAREWASR